MTRTPETYFTHPSGLFSYKGDYYFLDTYVITYTECKLLINICDIAPFTLIESIEVNLEDFIMSFSYNSNNYTIPIYANNDHATMENKFMNLDDFEEDFDY